MLLTRSPLRHHRSGASLDLHVLSTPPAFVLSQDQTLHQCFRPQGPESRRLPDGDDMLISATEVNSQKTLVVRSIHQDDPTRPPSHPERDDHQARAGHMALTFGTLLSSQRTTAHRQTLSGLPRGNSPSLDAVAVTVNLRRLPRPPTAEPRRACEDARTVRQRVLPLLSGAPGAWKTVRA